MTQLLRTHSALPESEDRGSSVRRSRVLRAVGEEARGFGPSRWMLNVLPRLLPLGSGGRLRAAFYRCLGLRVGRGTLMTGAPTFGPGPARHVEFGRRCFINSHIYLDPAAPIVLGDGVSLGHHVMIITSDHQVGCPAFRAGALVPRPVTIEAGAWVAARATILPGVRIGQGAVVAAGAVVTRDVAPNVLVGGVPARILRHLSDDCQGSDGEPQHPTHAASGDDDEHGRY